MSKVKILKDSISPEGKRLTTMEVKLWRPLIGEFNTHRSFCLSGDSVLEFDLPSGTYKNKTKRIYTCRLDDFVDKWFNGANRVQSNPKKIVNISWMKNSSWYTAIEISNRCGISKSVLHSACRSNLVEAIKQSDGSWTIHAGSFIQWRNKKPDHTRFSIRNRLSSMRIRQLNEDTGLIENSTIVDCQVSGIKKVYQIQAESFKVKGSEDHLILTDSGYKKIKDLIPNQDYIVVKRFGLRDDDKSDQERHRKINGKWRMVWQRHQKDRLLKLTNNKCMWCPSEDRLQIHHIVPVHIDPSLAETESNIVLICQNCHSEEHKKQGWQIPQYLYGDLALLTSVTYAGEEPTYDLMIAGKFPNFVANGIIVHNSRNSASSRAIPVEKQLKKVRDNPVWPIEWPSEQPGMQGGTLLKGNELYDAKSLFLYVQERTVNAIDEYLNTYPDKSDRLHKSLINRLLEPYLEQVIIVSSTEWENFFTQRCSPLAQPEIRVVAEEMREALYASTPTLVDREGWHLPLIQEDELELPLDTLIQVSVARCARVSYLTHDGVRDIEEDVKLYERLIYADPPHWSPLEHVATPMWLSTGNFEGWEQLRHIIGTE